MRKRPTPPSFPEYLREAIARSGFQTPTDFARVANISPSVVSRWLAGAIRPTIPLLERVAPHLGANLSTLVRIAWPEIDEGMAIANDAPELHPRAAEINRMLTGPALTDLERDTLERLLEAVVAGYRKSSARRVV